MALSVTETTPHQTAIYRRQDTQVYVSGDLGTQCNTNTEAAPYSGDMSEHGYPLIKDHISSVKYGINTENSHLDIREG